MPWPHPILDQRGNRRELHHRLRDPAARVLAQARGELVELLLRGVGPDDETLAARAVDRLHDELVESVEHLLERPRLLETPGVDVGDDRLLREVVADQVGQVRIHELVVGDAVADRVRDRDVAEAGRQHESRRAEHGVRAELQWVEELVVDPAVDDVDSGGAGGGAHPHLAAAAEQVAALDELDAHQAGQQGVLEVRRVVDAGGEHDDRRVVHALGSGCPQRLQQSLRVVADRSHSHRHEQLGQGLRHDPAVRDDVAHAGRHPHVVLEHPPGARLVADEVDTRDLDAHAVRTDDPGRLAVEVAGRADQPRRDDPVEHGLLLSVDVGQEGLERAHALLHTGFDDRPLGLLDDARHGVERERALLAGEVEGDTLREIGAGEGLGASAELVLRHPGERTVDLFVCIAGALGVRRRRVGEHLIPGRGPPSLRRDRAVTVE